MARGAWGGKAACSRMSWEHGAGRAHAVPCRRPAEPHLLLVPVPMAPAASSMTTSSPAWAAARAHASPTTPAPTTATSASAGTASVARLSVGPARPRPSASSCFLRDLQVAKAPANRHITISPARSECWTCVNDSNWFPGITRLDRTRCSFSSRSTLVQVTAPPRWGTAMISHWRGI